MGNNSDLVQNVEITHENIVSSNYSETVSSEESSDDEEYDFDKEFSGDEDDYSLSNGDFILDNDTEIVSSEVDESIKIVKNIHEIMKVRVNNTLAMANKKILNEELEKFKLLNDFTFDQEIGYLVCNLLDGTIRAASDNNIIISYEYDSSVKQNLLELEKITYVYNKITDSNKNIAIITDEEWENEKNNYIVCLKDGNSYNFIEEPEEIYEEEVKNDIIKSSAVELFGDIVEIN